MNKKLILFSVTLLMVMFGNAQELVTSQLFTDGVVLQQKSKVSIWGWGTPGKTVIVKGSWGKQTQTSVDETGKWLLEIKTPKAGGPYNLNVSDGTTEILIKEVLIGEVWICSGQSNMDMPLKGWLPNDTIHNYKEEIKRANYPKIRMFNVKKGFKIEAIKDAEGSWMTCNPENVKEFSAVGYFFGRELVQNLNVPIGLIHTTYGGSPIEAWMPKEDLIDLPRFKTLERDIKNIKENVGTYDTWVEGLKSAQFGGGRRLQKFKHLVLCDASYRTSDYNDSHWKTVDLPAKWEDIGSGEYDGIIWYRKDFELTRYNEEAPLELHLGKIADVDECYVNGILIGESYDGDSTKLDRVYTIPKRVLKAGKNTIAIRVMDVWGEAGFISDKKPELIQKGELVLELHKSWKYLQTAEYINWKLLCFDEGEHRFSKKPHLPFVVEQKAPTALYNAMILPVMPYKAKGIIWYQGESNTSYPKEYKTLFPRLINRWRNDWKEESIPFYFAQIAPFKNYDNDKGKNTAELREVQFQAQTLPNTGMAVLLDLGDKWKIHPGKKQGVGKRLALWALAKDYKQKIAYSGPTYKSVEFKKGKAILSFNNIHSGLVLKEGGKDIFQIAGKDGEFYTAQSKIEGEKLIVWANKVPNPTQVKYAFTNWVEPTLYNKDGLPASSFRTFK